MGVDIAKRMENIFCFVNYFLLFFFFFFFFFVCLSFVSNCLVSASSQKLDFFLKVILLISHFLMVLKVNFCFYFLKLFSFLFLKKKNLVYHTYEIIEVH